MGQFQRAAAVSEIPDGTGKTVTVNATEIALFNVKGAFHALNNTCPHSQGPLGDGTLQGNIVSCPWHGWRFDVTDGSCLQNRNAQVRTYRTKVEDDSVFVEF